MASTLYMVVEHFKNNDAAAVYHGFVKTVAWHPRA